MTITPLIWTVKGFLRENGHDAHIGHWTYSSKYHPHGLFVASALAEPPGSRFRCFLTIGW